MSNSVHRYPPHEEDAHEPSMACRCVPCLDVIDDAKTGQMLWIVLHSRTRKEAA